MPQSKRQQRAGQASNMRTFYIVLAVIALGGIGWITYSLVGGGGATAVEPIQLTGLDDPQALLNAARPVPAGESNAPVQVLVFSDFTCPACKRWTTMIEPLVKSEFVEAGKVKLVYYDFPLGGAGEHRHSFIAARAARCAAEQDRFWDFHDLLFARQTEWAYERNAPLDRFNEYATVVGLDRAAFDGCVRSERHADVVTANRMLGENLGVNSTPTVFIGNRSVPFWGDWAAVQAAVQRELGS